MGKAICEAEIGFLYFTFTRLGVLDNIMYIHWSLDKMEFGFLDHSHRDSSFILSKPVGSTLTILID